MINRGAIQASQYKYNPLTKKLEKDKNNTQTIESLSKQARKQVYDLSQIGAEVNKMNEPPEPINQITVITGEDNLIHNYFYDFEYSWDARNCLSVATVKMPRLDEKGTKYWATYQGPVTVYGGYNFTFDKVNEQEFQDEQDAANSLAQYNEISDIKPFFRGTVSRIKQYQTHIVVYINSIGERFKQEIPEDFRQMYINGQNVRDAFQAICEFLGVDYICPPKKINETEADTGNSNNNEGDGTENNVTSQQQIAQQIANTVKNKVEQTSNQNTNSTNDQNNNQTDSQNTDLTNNQEIEVTINGYDDINFDANGVITHGSTTIETSPDMADTLIQMDENPLERYLEDESGIVEKIQKFLDGDMFEELHNKVMDYGAITVEAASTTSSDITTNDPGNTNTTDLSNDTSNNTQNETSNNSSNTKKKTPQPSAKAISVHKGPQALSKQYINTLTPEQARKLRTSNYRTNKYTSDTLQKLLWRSIGMTLK